MAPHESAEFNLVRHLVNVAESEAPDVPGYVRQYLSSHIREAGPKAWGFIAKHPALLDSLNPDAVAEDVLRSDFRLESPPDEIIASVGARRTIAAASESDRPGIRQLSLARFAGVHHPLPRVGLGGGDPEWSVSRALLVDQIPHTTITASKNGIRFLLELRSHPGAAIFAAGDTAGTIRIWDLITGSQQAVLSGHIGPARAAAEYSGFLVTGGEDGFLNVWNPDSGELIDRIDTGAPIWAMAVLRGSQLVSGGKDGRVHSWAWDPQRWSLVSSNIDITPPPTTTGAGAWITSLAVDGDMLCIGYDSGDISIWNRNTARTDYIANHKGGGVRSLVFGFSGSGRRAILAGFSDRRVIRWDYQDGQPPHEIGHDFAVRAMALIRRPGGDVRVAISDGHSIALMDPRTRERAKQLVGHTKDVRAMVQVSGIQGGLSIATGGDDGTIRYWRDWPQDDEFEDVIAPVTCLTGIRETGVLVVGSAKGEVHAIRDAEDEPFHVWPDLGSKVTGLAELVGISGESCFAAAVADEIRLFDLVDGREIGNPHELHADSGITAINVSHDKRTLLTGDEAGLIAAWSIVEGSAFDWVLPSQLGRDQRAIAGIASSVLDSTFLIADTSGGTWVADVSRPTMLPKALSSAFEANPITALTSGRFERNSNAWIAARGTFVEVLGLEFEGFALPAAHESTVRAVVCLPQKDRDLVITGDTAGRLSVCDLATSTTLQIIEIGIPILALSAASEGIAVGTTEGVVTLSARALDRLDTE